MPGWASRNQFITALRPSYRSVVPLDSTTGRAVGLSPSSATVCLPLLYRGWKSGLTTKAAA
jgi:hypothetical protein